MWLKAWSLDCFLSGVASILGFEPIVFNVKKPDVIMSGTPHRWDFMRQPDDQCSVLWFWCQSEHRGGSGNNVEVVESWFCVSWIFSMSLCFFFGSLLVFFLKHEAFGFFVCLFWKNSTIWKPSGFFGWGRVFWSNCFVLPFAWISWIFCISSGTRLSGLQDSQPQNPK